MPWLQSNQQFNELAQLDHETGKVSIKLRDSFTEKTQMTEGLYAILANTFVAVYKFGKELFIRIGNLHIPLTADVLITTSGGSINRTFEVTKAGQTITH